MPLIFCFDTEDPTARVKLHRGDRLARDRSVDAGSSHASR